MYRFLCETRDQLGVALVLGDVIVKQLPNVSKNIALWLSLVWVEESFALKAVSFPNFEDR